MKKKLAFILISFLIVVSILYWLRYGQVFYSYQIPEKAKTVLKVDVRGIEKQFLKSFFQHPTYYLKGNDEDDKKIIIEEKTKNNFLSAIELPRVLLFFSNAVSLNNEFYSSKLKIKKHSILLSLLNKNNFKKISLDKQFQVFKKKGFYVVVNGNNELIIFCNSSFKKDFQYTSYFSSANYLSTESPLYKRIKNNTHIISLSTLKAEINASIDKNELSFVGSISSEGFFNSSKHIVSSLKRDVADLAHFKINISSQKIAKLLSNKKDIFGVSKDSIFKYWKGDLDLRLKSIVANKDSIITYEYDDDFNKIKKVSFQEIYIPNTLFYINDADNTFHSYLAKTNIYTLQNSDTVFAKIPTLALLKRSNSLLFSNFLTKKYLFQKENENLFYLQIKIAEIVESNLASTALIPKKIQQKLKKITSISSEWNKNNKFQFQIKTKSEIPFFGIFF